MTSTMKTILVIGGTSGIGESFARRFHKLGKKVIITGRRSSRLAEIQKSLPGSETYQMDNTQLKDIPKHVETLFSRYEIDTVWVNGGIMVQSDIKDLSSSSDDTAIEEITVNLTAPIIFARHVVPRLLKRDVETQFMVTTSGLGFTILGKLYPIYCSTKAGLHSYMYGLRQALKETNVNIIEIVPPLVTTDLNTKHSFKPDPSTALSLQQLEDEMFRQLESPAKSLKEVLAGNTHKRVGAWRSGSGKLMEEWGISD